MDEWERERTANGDGNQESTKINSGYVYMIGSGGYTKIGKTQDIAKRIDQYMTHNPNIDFFFARACENMDQTEAYLLDEFANNKTGSRDWFLLDSDDILSFMTGNMMEKYKKLSISKFRMNNRFINKTNNDAKEIIRQTLINTGAKNQIELRTIGQVSGIGDSRMRAALQVMENDGELRVEKGMQNSKIYFIENE